MGNRAGGGARGGGGGRSGGGGGAGAGGGSAASLKASRTQAAKSNFDTAVANVKKARVAYNNALVAEGQHSGDKAAIAKTNAAEKKLDAATKRFTSAKKRYENVLGRKLKWSYATGKWS